jgi:hypothetical protein
MKQFVLIFLFSLTLIITIALSPDAKSAGLSSVAAMSGRNSPLSPLPSPSDSDPSDSSDASRASNTIASDFVWTPQASGQEIWIKTQQFSVGWWDANGQLHIELQVDGIVKIPLQAARMISIPGDAAGVAVPEGWQKQMRPENGEWVIVRIA